MTDTVENSLGKPGITIFPSNRSVILADSRFRDADTNTEQPYDFTCTLSGTGIYAEELYYAKLFWTQNLFAHRRDSCEIRFKIGGIANPNQVYVVYTTPYQLYTLFDGNGNGTNFLTPLVNSYAYNIETGFNNDIRLLQSNQVPVNGTGKVLDPYGNPIIWQFRYSSSKGFALSIKQPVSNPSNILLTFELLDCSWVSKGHFVHGFGIYDSNLSPTPKYIPRSGQMITYFSDCTPLLLPFRYIVIISEELNKDRRLMSFHNGPASKFVNELAIISLNYTFQSAYLGIASGDDSTVISLREGYTPQQFRITILKEDGNILQGDDPISAMLQSDYVPAASRNSYFWDGTFPSRGDSYFMNALLFGYNFYRSSLNSSFQFPYNVTVGTGMNGTSGSLNNPFLWIGMNIAYYDPFRFYDSLNAHEYGLASNFLQATQSIQLAAATPFNPAYGPNLGFSTATTLVANDCGTGGTKKTVFQWYPQEILTPTISYAAYAFVRTLGTTQGDVYWNIVMYDADYVYPLGYMPGTPICITPLKKVNGLYNTSPLNTQLVGQQDLGAAAKVTMQFNPNINPSDLPQTMNVCFGIRLYCSKGNPTPIALNGSTYVRTAPNPYVSPTSSITIWGKPQQAQPGYIDPVTADFPWGNPDADGLKDDVIHELIAILEYN